MGAAGGRSAWSPFLAEVFVIKSRLTAGLKHKAAKGELRQGLPIGLDYDEDDQVILTPDEAVREAIFLNGGASYTVAAEQLGLHYNTVKYRLGRALARRGRPITDDRFDVELALLLCHWYGDALLLALTP
jgi:DNA invertase Pin-like site-specific DNA recombinase